MPTTCIQINSDLLLAVAFKDDGLNTDEGKRINLLCLCNRCRWWAYV